MKSNKEIPLVAIIVPCYNQGQYLGECLDSVLAQTVQDWVCIVVNDGSTDNTANVAQEYCLKSDKIHYHYQENAGLSATRNKGIALTDSEYILPLDADDMLEPNYLEVVLGLFDQNPEIKIAYTNSLFFGAINRVVEYPTFSMKTILYQNIITATALYKRTSFDETDGYDPNLKAREDWDFWLSILDEGDTVAKYWQSLFLYRQSEGSMSKGVSFKQANKIRAYVYKKHEPKFTKYIDYSTLNKYLSLHKKNWYTVRFKAFNKKVKRKIQKFFIQIGWHNEKTDK